MRSRLPINIHCQLYLHFTNKYSRVSEIRHIAVNVVTIDTTPLVR